MRSHQPNDLPYKPLSINVILSRLIEKDVSDNHNALSPSERVVFKLP